MRIILRVTAVALGLVLPAFGQDATMFRGNLQHSGVYEGAGVPNFNKVKWSFHTGGMVISSPAVVEGMAYVGSTDGSFYAVDAGTGKEKWKFEVKSRITSSPACRQAWSILALTTETSTRWMRRRAN